MTRTSADNDKDKPLGSFQVLLIRDAESRGGEGSRQVRRIGSDGEKTDSTNRRIEGRRARARTEISSVYQYPGKWNIPVGEVVPSLIQRGVT